MFGFLLCVIYSITSDWKCESMDCIFQKMDEKLQYISNLFIFRTERNFIVQISEHCYFSLRCDVRLSCIFVTMVSINSGITTPLTSMKFATDLVTVVSLILPDEALLTDNTKLYLSSYFFK